MLAFDNEIARRLQLNPANVRSVLQLLHEGATIPFIARYRKDRTGALDEVAIQKIQEEEKFLRAFEDRKAAISKSINEQEKMTDELQQKLDFALTLAELEDIYLPYRPKRKTKASVAREMGLEPLALLILEQKPDYDPEALASSFLSEGCKTIEDALSGAKDIIAEMISEDAGIRAKLRRLFENKAVLQSKLIQGKKEEAVKFRDYFDYSEPVSGVPSHRALAVLRGFAEGFLRIAIEPQEEVAIELIGRHYIKGTNSCSEQVKKSVRDSYKRLLQPGLETEFRTALKQRADEEAIAVFAENLRQLLLSSPLNNKNILAIDPGYRTGCKVVCLDEQGQLKRADLIYIHEPGKLQHAGQKIRELVQEYRIEAFAIGDGTAGREAEQFIKQLELGLPVFLVNEDGASIYSASETAREEFPDQDVTVRGAVSIGHRLMDPLAELVKIDPKSIGVGQYQHDVNQARLKECLDQTVVSCVNTVGVNLNTAGKYLLAYVSGINMGIAENIIKYRNEIGKFSDRKQLLKVPRLGEKAFEQCAGFMRIKDARHPLDGSAVHPEAYAVVEQMAKDLGVKLDALPGNEALINKIELRKYVSAQFGEHTIRDILNELKKPGLDPRSEVQQFEFAGIYKIEDVQPGMVVPGIVTNLTRFGAFVDIGVKQDGLVHISEICHDYIRDPSEKLKLNQKVMVKITDVDLARKRIALSIKQTLEGKQPGGPEKSNNRGNILKKSPQQGKELKEVPLNDALAALRRKFGK